MLLFLSSTATVAITLPLTTVGGVNPKTNYRCSASFADACQISSPRPRDKSLQNRLANLMGLRALKHEDLLMKGRTRFAPGSM